MSTRCVDCCSLGVVVSWFGFYLLVYELWCFSAVVVLCCDVGFVEIVAGVLNDCVSGRYGWVATVLGIAVVLG